MLFTRIGITVMCARTSTDYGISMHNGALEKFPIFLQFFRKRHDFHL